MLEQATFLPLKLEFENMVMSMLIGNPGHQVFDALKEGNEAIFVNVSKVLDEQHVDHKVDGEHPPVEGVERPPHPLLPPPSNHDSEQARVHEYHGDHEGGVGQGQDPEVHLQLQVASPRPARCLPCLLLMPGGVARQTEAVVVVDQNQLYSQLLILRFC